MERLTYWSKQNERFEVYTDGIVHYGSITDRLAEYEDTGLTPEEIKKLQADRDYWKAEALKHCAKLGEIKLLAGRKEQ